MKYLKYLFGISLLLMNAVFAHEEEGGGARVGKEMAVLEMKDGMGFRLSEKAIQKMGIKTETVTNAIPKTSYAFFRDKKAVYRLRDGWFKRIDVNGNQTNLKALGFLPTDKIAINGVPLLRVTDMEVFGAEADEPSNGSGEEAHSEHDEKEEGRAHD